VGRGGGGLSGAVGGLRPAEAAATGVGSRTRPGGPRRVGCRRPGAASGAHPGGGALSGQTPAQSTFPTPRRPPAARPSPAARWRSARGRGCLRPRTAAGAVAARWFLHPPRPAGWLRPAHPIDLAAWKQQDYNQLARHQAAEAADEAFDAEVNIVSTTPLESSDKANIHGWISALPNIVGGISAISEIVGKIKAGAQIDYKAVNGQIIIRGPRSARQVLGLNPYTNRINAENVPRLFGETPIDRSFSSVSNEWVLGGLLLNTGVDYFSYKTGDYDRQEFGAALLFDTSTTIVSAAVGGFIAGGTAGAIAGAPALGIGAVPGAVIGGVVGALAGIGTSLVLNIFVRDWYIDTVSHGWDWLGR